MTIKEVEKTENAMMQDTAREIILDCLTGAMSAHDPHWAAIPAGVDPVRDAIYNAIVATTRAYPAPDDPFTASIFADFFGR